MRCLKQKSRKVSLGSIVSVSLVSLTIFSGFILSSNIVSADTSVVSKIKLSVPVSCNMTSTVDTAHNATIPNGTYTADIGQTTLKVLCNDSNGFSIYAIGYTGENYGTTTLIGRNKGATISTGTSTSGNNSAWAMKVTKVTDTSEAYLPNNLTIQNSFDSYHAVPDTYTQVASYSSSTDATLGSKLRATYATYVSGTQLADTYDGKVKYTLVHPYNASAPVPISRNLYYAITGSENDYTLTISDSDITSGAVAGGPVAIDGYEFDEQQWSSTAPWASYTSQIKSVVVSGTVAPTSTSAWFTLLEDCESWNLSGLKTDNVTDMSYMFFRAGYYASSFTMNLSSWNTSRVTNMSYMFNDAGRNNATTWSVGDLSSWDTSSVTSMYQMFSSAGYSATIWSIGDLSSWDTSSVTDMSGMFVNAGSSATSWSIGDLSSWDTSSVTNMSIMFDNAGRSATTWSIGDLSSWDTSSVTDMSSMFVDAGYSATTFNISYISSWDTSSVTDMSYMFNYAGYNASSFTLDLSSWDTSRVTGMNSMFSYAGYNATTWSVGDLSSWHTSNVTDMSNMFNYAGYNATTFDISYVSSWNTSSVTNMQSMFSNAGYSASSFILDLSSWDTSDVTDMSNMFNTAGYSATVFTLNLSSWNTSSVTVMRNMFRNAGSSTSTWSVTIPKTNDGTATGPISNTTARLYGKTSSNYATPRSGKSFTLAN